MNIHIKEKFEKIGARINMGDVPPINQFLPRRDSDNIMINVINDKKGQIFDIRTGENVELTIADFRPDEHHLLLLAKILDPSRPHVEPQKVKFLCGHDDREWFTCQISNTSVSTVHEAKLSLRPKAVRESHRVKKVKPKNRVKKKNEGSLRQGEWFFIPADIEDPKPDLILRNERLMVSNSRGGGKPHIAQFAFRTGGEVVYVPTIPAILRQNIDIDVPRLSAGLTEKEKEEYLRLHPKAKRWLWSHQIRNPKLYVKGNIRHKDHPTLKLRQWHEVHLNTETRGRFNVFLD